MHKPAAAADMRSGVRSGHDDPPGPHAGAPGGNRPLLTRLDGKLPARLGAAMSMKVIKWRRCGDSGRKDV
jgi:hypothetical protein